MGVLGGVVKELEDCSFPLLVDIVSGSDAEVIFGDTEIAILVGAKPRSLGMERSDLLAENAAIFSGPKLLAILSKSFAKSPPVSG